MSTDLLSTSPSLVTPIALAGVLLLGALAGLAIGARRALRERRALQRTLAERELELLEVRADVARLGQVLVDTPRRERVLRLALGRLRDARERERRRFVDASRLRLALVEANARTKRAVALAGRAARRVRELEAEAGRTGTITTRAAKSYGNGEAVTVSVVDHETAEARLNGASRVPHHDRARLARLTSSNEARCADDSRGASERPFGKDRAGELSIIDGLAADDEDRLAAHGIHRLEQLASLTENELLGLVGASDGRRWIGDARALLDGRPST